VIGGATEILDLTFLYGPPILRNFPDGDFQKAISKGFAKLIESSHSPSIASYLACHLVLFLRGAVAPNYWDLEKSWLTKTIELSKDVFGKNYTISQMKCPILGARPDRHRGRAFVAR
jgi:hypothetical protein